MNVNLMCIETFGVSVKELTDEAHKYVTKRDNYKVYQLRCLAWWIYRKRRAETYKSIGDMLGVSVGFIKSSVEIIDKELK